ncbi:MAPEG family protein [Rhodanobacter sp. BL-MT-08]
MTIGLWCVLVGLLMPFLWTGVAKSMGRYDLRANQHPRDFLATLKGPASRANAAQLNSFEAFPAFAAAVVVAQYAHASQHTIDVLSIAWVALRLIYGVLYIANLAALRSLVWFAAMGCVVGLFIAAA